MIIKDRNRMMFIIASSATIVMIVGGWVYYSYPPQSVSTDASVKSANGSSFPTPSGESWVCHNGKIYLYRIIEANETIQTIMVNDKPISEFRDILLPLRDGKKLVCVEFKDTDCTPSLTAKASWSSGHESVFSGTRQPSWWVYPSQYDPPLRIVHCEMKGSDAKLTLYNESIATKPDLEILGISINGHDVTASAHLPEGPLPAKQGYPFREQRYVSVALDGVTSPYDIELTYRLVAPRYASGIPHDRAPQQLRFRLVPGSQFPIGQAGTITLPGCICIHHGGLESPIDDDLFQRRLQAARASTPNIPVYARFSENASVDEIVRLAAGLDFIVVAPLLVRHQEAAVLTVDPGDCLRQLSTMALPTVASLHLGMNPEPSSSEFRWWILSVLGSGSRGLRFSKPSTFNPQPALHWLQRQGEWLGAGWPVALEASADQPGVRVATWACGTNSIALFVINEFCTLSPRQLRKPFYAVSRRGVSASVRTGRDWAGNVTATSCDNGKRLPISAMGSGKWKITLPDFETGCLIRLDHLRSSQGEAPTVASVSSKETIGLEPSSPPFVRVGRCPLGDSVPVSLSIINRAATPATVRVEPMSWQSIPAAEVRFEPMSIRGNQTGILRGTWHLPLQAGAVARSVRVIAEDRSDDEFLCFLEADLYQPLSADPASVEFGTVEVDGQVVDRVIRLHGEPGITNVAATATFEPPDPRLSAVVGTDGVVTVSLTPNRPSSIHSVLKLRRADKIGPEVQVEVTAEVRPRVQIQPSRLVLAGDQPKRRSFVLRASRPFAVQVSNPLPRGISPVGRTDGFRSEHSLEFVCDPAARGAASRRDDLGVIIRCEFEDRNSTRFVIPVVWINTGLATKKEPKREGAKPSVSGQVRDFFSRIDRLIHRIRGEKLPRDCPNWVRAHTLLLFVPARSRTPEEVTELDLRVRKLLRRPDSTDMAGILAEYRGAPELIRQGRLFDLEHHPGQYFTYLGMAEVPLETRLDFSGKTGTLGQFYRRWLRTVRPRGEMSYLINALCSYHPAGEGWEDKFGQPQRLGPYLERLRRNPEMVCDQSHMMMALSRLTFDRRWLNDPTVAAQWTPTLELLTTKVRTLRCGQEADGRFPVQAEVMAQDYRRVRPELDRRIGIHYTGHHLEWLTIFLPEQELREEWILRAVGFLISSIEAEYSEGRYFQRLHNEEEYFTAGFLCHAVSALSQWRDKTGRFEYRSEEE